MTDSDETLRYIAAALTDLRRQYRQDGQHWPPPLESIRLLARSGQMGPEFDGVQISGDDRLVLTYEDVGRRLSVSQRTVRRLVATDQIPMVKVGDSSRITCEDLDAYVRGLERRRGLHDEEVFGAA